jgi:hypothetical protein
MKYYEKMSKRWRRSRHAKPRFRLGALDFVSVGKDCVSSAQKTLYAPTKRKRGGEIDPIRRTVSGTSVPANLI